LANARTSTITERRETNAQGRQINHGTKSAGALAAQPSHTCHASIASSIDHIGKLHAGKHACAHQTLEGHTMTQTKADETAMVVEYLKQWAFAPNSTKHQLVSKRAFNGPAEANYNLKNTEIRKFAQWEDQIGMNIGFTDDAGPATAARVSRWFITRKAGNQGSVRYGERVALGYGTSPSFLRRADRWIGPNLEWTTSPIFEWKLLGGSGGTPVNSGERLALYNKAVGECLIHFDRDVGADFGWPTSRTWSEQIEDLLGRAIRDYWQDAVRLLLEA